MNEFARCWGVLALVLLCASGAARAQQEVPLWKDGAPGGFKHPKPELSEDKHETGRLDRYVTYVSNPTLTLYPVAGATGPQPIVLVLPGGGFRFVCIDKEGHEMARFLNSVGIAAAVLKYRTTAPDAERSWDLFSPLLALGDMGRAIRLMRANAAEWKIDPARINVIGFSAGGTMAIRHTIDANDGKPDAADPVERMSSRPNSIALVYTTLPDQKLPKVDKAAPYFIVHGADDQKAAVGVATKVFQTVNSAGGSAELHVFAKADHGFGVAPASGTVRGWPALYAEWLRSR